MSDKVSVKGIRDGLLVILQDTSSEAQEVALLSFIDKRSGFFAGARLALNVGAAVWYVKQLSALREALSQRNIHLWAVLGESPVTEKTAQLLGLATRLSHRAAPRRSRQKPPADETALWVRKTVRSGVRIEADANIVVLGDVNPGGEVIASGSVMVWGRLRGAVHAGCDGNRAACVCALTFAPQRLQIADALLPGVSQAQESPQMAQLQDDKVVVSSWKQR